MDKDILHFSSITDFTTALQSKDVPFKDGDVFILSDMDGVSCSSCKQKVLGGPVHWVEIAGDRNIAGFFKLTDAIAFAQTIKEG